MHNENLNNTTFTIKQIQTRFSSLQFKYEIKCFSIEANSEIAPSPTISMKGLHMANLWDRSKT